MPFWTVIPFVLMLLVIALMPQIFSRWWSSNINKGIVAAGLGIPVIIYILPIHPLELVVTLKDYISFIILLGSLYIIAGGIHIKGSMAGTPLINTLVLGIGAILANFIGTTGASILLIRPLIRANKHRRHKAHIFVFCIFVVCNCAGLLTPLGDPPLFMGFLKGIPFLWTLRLFPVWLFVNAAILLIFNIMDQYWFNREELAVPEVKPKHPLKIEGARNFIFLAGIMATIFCSGTFHWPFGAKEALMIVLTIFAYTITAKHIYQENEFTFGPITEVGVLFAGIFATMIPALLVLNERGGELGLAQPWHFFWASGGLSSFLDNTPTYLTFAAATTGLPGIGIDIVRHASDYGGLLVQNPLGIKYIVAISCGAVFMGANTYIGNGPNFMLKAIAEESHIKMPSFFGYMVYSALILIPIFILATLIFFR